MSDIEVGKFIVYESFIRDRFVVRKVVGGTGHYWQVLDPRHLDDHPRRIKKSSLGPVGVFDDGHVAKYVATNINEMLAKLNADFDIMRKRLLNELSAWLEPNEGEQNDG